MSSPDTSNHHFQMAVRFVNQTNRHIFLTGKAGTGKTTFLRYIRENSPKKMAVVAPTGVAAINAGGVTMHSFFNLPFGAFIPDLLAGWNNNSNINTPTTLFKNLRLSREKKELLQELELLIIDEVSMLRADILDEIDTILRQFRRRPYQPFGGVQMLYIGDMFQLPPVVNDAEWELLKNHYKSPFFFDAQVMRESPPLYLELKKIYRQHEIEFISLLNNIRNNKADYDDLERLHLHYKPGFMAGESENYIILTTHNAKADNINQASLNKLPGRSHEFKAEIIGEFNEKAYPVDETLSLKEGAQIMFIKNDKGESRRYYNGKIATIARIQENTIVISFPGENGEMELEKETWKNIRYHYNREKDSIQEEELGKFIQYPIRLAWAITIHKSQGLTFEKAIIDAGASFAPGQVYVALSRLTTLDGLILHSRILPHCIKTDERVLEFTRSELEEDILHEQFQQEQNAFVTQSLLQSFDWSKLAAGVQLHYDDYDDRQIPDKEQTIRWAKELLDSILKQQEMAQKFIKQLSQLIPAAPQDNYQHLHQRITAAADFFMKALNESIASIRKHSNEVKFKRRVKKYSDSLTELILLPERKKKELQQTVRITEGLMRGENIAELLQAIQDEFKPAPAPVAADQTEASAITKPAAKAPKGETKKLTLQLFKEGKKIPEIAALRELAVSTIESHLHEFIRSGEVDIKEVVIESRIEAILKILDEIDMESNPLTLAKQKLPDDFSFNEIRAVLYYRQRQQAGVH